MCAYLLMVLITCSHTLFFFPPDKHFLMELTTLMHKEEDTAAQKI